MWGGRTVGKRRAEALACSLPEPRSSPASPAPGGSRLPGRVPLIPVRSCARRWLSRRRHSSLFVVALSFTQMESGRIHCTGVFTQEYQSNLPPDTVVT